MTPQQRLSSGLGEMGLSLEGAMEEKLLAYLALLQKWNKAYNLTAIRDMDQMVIRHLLDSLSLKPYINASPVLDVGTGAGLPGIPLAICLPHLSFVLLDSNSKKTRFLNQAKIELGLDNIEVIHSRVEDYQPSEPFQIITCRAFAALNTILDRTQHLVTSTTRLLAMKGKEEAATLPEGFIKQGEYPLQVAFLGEERRLIEIAPDTDQA